MRFTAKRTLLLGFLAIFVMANAAAAAEPTKTLIHVETMHCAGCAKKIAGKLQKVAAVDKVTADVEKKTMIVVAMRSLPSPRSLWEATEAAGYKPTKIVSPRGTFTSKPKS